MNMIPGMSASPEGGMHSPDSEGGPIESLYEVARPEFSSPVSDGEIISRLGDAESSLQLAQSRIGELEHNNEQLTSDKVSLQEENSALEAELAEQIDRGRVLEAENRRLRQQLEQDSFANKQKIYELEHENRRLNEGKFDDHLTGLKNKAALDIAIEHLKNQPDRTVAFFDANNFGQINKHPQYGQAAGDMMIRKLAEAIKTTAKKFNIEPRDVFRAGGDEFVVIAPREVAEDFVRETEKEFGIHLFDKSGYHRLSEDIKVEKGAEFDQEKGIIVSLAGSVDDDLNTASNEVAERKKQVKHTAKGIVNRLFPDRHLSPMDEVKE